MSITLNFQCDGCHDKKDGKSFIKKATEQIGNSNFVRKLPWDIQAQSPNGWIASDPYTDCCYCPKCWDEIEGNKDND